jgi:poly [ADP-ribose] polymerase
MSIVKEKMLILVSSAVNSNKFYHVTLSEDDVVTKRWGRVGTDGTISRETTGEKGFDRTVAAKEKKGYRETEVITVEDEPQHSDNTELSKIAKTALVGKNAVKNAVLEELIDTLVRLNNHDILETSGGLIKVNNSGLITTPLGLIKPSSIASAKDILKDLEKTPVNSSSFTSMLEDYLSLIPQKVPYRRGWEKDFFNSNNTFAYQMDFLKQLADSLALQEDRKKVAEEAAKDGPIESEDDIAAKYEKLFKLKIGLLEDEREFGRIEKLYNGGKSSNHSSSYFKLKRIYTLQDEEGELEYSEAKKILGNERALWHGTRANNVLSILRSKLFVAPLTGSGIQIQGRLFGSGLYFGNAEISKGLNGRDNYGASKSLNYSAGGVWDHGPRDNRCFMFLANGVLGKEYHPKTYGLSGDTIQRSGKYDSIYAHARDTGLRNDEIIIWNTKQINLRYLCEFGV